MRVRLHKLVKPLTFRGSNNKLCRTIYILSTFDHSVDGTAKTGVFPASELGQVLDWKELEGSLQGDHDHDRAMSKFRSHYGY